MIRFVDTHTHLYDEAFDDDFDETIARVKEAGVVRCIFPGIDSSTYERQTRAAEKCGDFVSEGMGLHPTSVAENWKDELDFAVEKIRSGRYIAVGEIGMDCHWSRDFVKEQLEVFAQQLELAHELSLPVIIHAREATEEIFRLFDAMKGRLPRGVFHAFSGSRETYARIASYGDFMVGIGGVVTFKNAGVARSVADIPLERILLETDSPYLTPVPFRGKRNDSGKLVYIAEKIALIKGISIAEVAQATTANAFRMFGLKQIKDENNE